MKIFYDHQHFDTQKIGGITRYFYEIMRNNTEDCFDLGVRYTDNFYLLNDKDFNVKKNIYGYENFLPNLSFRGKGRIFNYLKSIQMIDYASSFEYNRKICIDMLKKGDFDIFHPTYYDTYFLDYIGNKPFVLTIHDMIHEKFPELFPILDGTIKSKEILAKNATHIIAISECTKRDIMEIYGIDENKISVVYHGSSLKNSKDLVSSKMITEILKKKYFLFTGTRTNYKNFYFLLYSISSILVENRDLFFICTASDFTSSEYKLLEELGIEKQVLHVFVNDNELYSLYKNSIAFIFPSYYEGFGIPILEAFEAECPLILANSSCFPEIAGDAALYFDPKNKFQLVESCKKLINDNKLRLELINKGKDRLKFFSWKKCAEETLRVYRNVLNEF